MVDERWSGLSYNFKDTQLTGGRQETSTGGLWKSVVPRLVLVCLDGFRENVP